MTKRMIKTELENALKNKVASIFLILGTSLVCAGSFADGAANGDAFRATASEYASKAEHASSLGLGEIAGLYLEQSTIKANAANLADKGQWSDINWDRYHANEGRIGVLLSGTKSKK